MSRPQPAFDDEPTGIRSMPSISSRAYALVIHAGGRLTTARLPEQGAVVLGRGSRTNVAIADASVSREHAVLTLTLTTPPTIADLGSRNGTRLNGLELNRTPTEIPIGGILELGDAFVALQLAGVDAANLASVAAFGAAIAEASLPPPIAPLDAPIVTGLRASVEEVERARVVGALQLTEGNQSRAAKLLGISRNTFMGRMERFGLARPRKR